MRVDAADNLIEQRRGAAHRLSQQRQQPFFAKEGLIERTRFGNAIGIHQQSVTWGELGTLHLKGEIGHHANRGSSEHQWLLDAPSRPDEGEVATTVGETLGEPDERFDLVELRETVRPVLAELSEREREILKLRFFQGMTQSMVGEKLGISQMHVSRLQRRALAALNEAVDPDGNSSAAAG